MLRAVVASSIGTVTAGAGYANAQGFAGLEARAITSVILNEGRTDPLEDFALAIP